MPGLPNYYGQDAQYAGATRSYTVLGGGTMVQDNVTGLIWEMKDKMDGKTDYVNLHDADNTYTWCDTNPLTNGGTEGVVCGTDDTEGFIDALNGANFGGYDDWRLPTMKELLSLVDYKGSGPAIDPVFATTMQSNEYWSSTTFAAFIGAAWAVSFSDGADTADLKTNPNFVRAVRGGQTPLPNRFVDNGDTVTDTVTCLQWQEATMDTKNGVGPDTYTWQEALAASENLTLAGHSDWRLPDIMELKPLVDFSRYNPAIDPVFASTTPSNSYWSSTTYAGNFSTAWLFSYYGGYGHRFYDSKLGVGYVRAVRSGNCSEVFPWEIFMPAINSKRAVVK